MPRWAVVGVESSVPWPDVDTEVEFRGYRLLLRPATDEHYASVAFQHPDDMALEDAVVVIRHFLSSLSWVERAGIREVGVTGGSGPFFIGRGVSGRVITPQFRHDYLPDPTDAKVRLALAFYREGMSAETPAYKFLSFFKILNIVHASGPAQVAWINAHLDDISDHRTQTRLRELGSTEPDIGEYLYGSGRCAVAHAFSHPLVDPENIHDNRRLASDLPLVQALAELMIEKEFGVKSRHTVWREHLYHLEGFRKLFGEQLVERLKGEQEVSARELPSIPAITLRVRDKPELESFVRLNPTVVAVENGTVWIRCDSETGSLQALVGLAVREEYLLFDPQSHVAVLPGSSVDALKAQRDHILLLKNLLLNGQLEIVVAETGERLGRTDAYIGQNIDLTASIRNLDSLLSQVDEALAQHDQGDV